MNLGYILCVLIFFILKCDKISCVTKFDGDSCVLAHNELRKKHLDTKEVTKSNELENSAKEYANRLRGSDTSYPVHPTRNAPLRKKRSLEDGIDENLHLELWDGDITYPSSDDSWFANKNRNSPVKMGRSIHKFCCSRSPHCPKEFFHGLSFPPPADGVVKDMYIEEEKDYDYATGKSKTIYSHVDHFARVVWKNTTEVGCGQSSPNSLGCVFTVVLYKIEGAIGSEDNYVKNIGQPIIAEKTNPTMTIVLSIIIVAIVIGIIVLIYCCRHNIDEKYKAAKIEIDVLKAEQELETDSTRFWWTRPLSRKQDVQYEKKTPPVAAYQSVKERPTIDVVTTPIKPRPSLLNIPRPSLELTSDAQPPVNVNQLVNRYRGMSMKRQDYLQLNPPQPPVKPPMFNPKQNEEVQGRRSSGKSVPPPKPPATRPPVTPFRPQPPASKQLDQQQSVEKPRPVPRKPPPGTRPSAPPCASPTVSSSGPSGKRPMIPMLPPKKPLPASSVDVEEDRPLSIAERRKFLEANNAV